MEKVFIVLSCTLMQQATAAPNYHGCLPGSKGASMKWCDFTMSHADRIKSLLSELTIDEKIGLLSPTSALGSSCNDHTAGAPRVGLSEYMWLVETNTGANSACIGGPENKCSTTFNGPLGMGASFNRTSWNLKGNVIGTELRAYNNLGWHRDAGGTITEKIGVTGYGPNLNNPRDPRFGRLSELPSEDPYHAGHYAVNMLAGQQEEDSNGHPKMVSFLKHFTAYSKETNRGHDTYNISMYDFFDTYLPQYEIAFTQGSARGVMCSYDAENGRPSCANDFILNEVMRKKWNRPDAFVSTDCGAVSNLRGAPAYAQSDEIAAAWVINNGTDLEMGSNLVIKNLKKALDDKMTTEDIINEAARRTLVHLFAAGRFDKLEDIEWSKYNEDDVASAYHTQIRDEAALQSFVLLKNDGKALPLKQGSHVAVVGPQAMGKGLFSDYFGDDICVGPKGNMDCVPTIAESVAMWNKNGVTTNATGVGISSMDKSQIDAAVAVAKAADVVVLALGIDKSIEHEGHDRSNITLPGLQEYFAQQIYALKKPTVLVLTNGGPLAIDNIKDQANGIVEAFNPAFGAPMLAKTLFGLENRWGKLPYTIYPADYIEQVDFANYDMSKAPGRTYRYYQGTPLYPFGYGLSYTTFNASCDCVNCPHIPMNFTCEIQNTGAMDGDEVILVYHSVGEDIRKSVDHPVPIKSLVEFNRVRLEKGASTKVMFSLPESAFLLTNKQGDKVLYKGERDIKFVAGGSSIDIGVTI